MREIVYLIFDVFTSQVFSGNPLGVVLNANGLTGDQMQAIAREFNLSETIFFQTSDYPGHCPKVRIFMPNGELPFAGHPTIGGAVAYAGAHQLTDNARVVLHEGVGPVFCTVTADQNGGRASFTVPHLPRQGIFQSPVDDVAAALGVSAADIGFAAHSVSLWSAGLPYVAIPVKNLSVLQKMRLDPQLWLKLDVAREGKVAAGFIYTVDPSGSKLIYRARMFAPWDGIPEDPATGSAAAAFSGVVWQAEALKSGSHDIIIHQGFEMGRPSRINLRLEGEAGNLTRATISGEAVKVAQGTLFLPDL
jgi:trans-2,3-dihydro-3-hydroxyanthranilate isomerase